MTTIVLSRGKGYRCIAIVETIRKSSHGLDTGLSKPVEKHFCMGKRFCRTREIGYLDGQAAHWVAKAAKTEETSGSGCNKVIAISYETIFSGVEAFYIQLL